ncbi:MAG: PstA family ABC transporter permease [Phycisphaerales bacterium]
MATRPTNSGHTAVQPTLADLARRGTPRSPLWRTLKNRLFLGICVGITALCVAVLVVLLWSVVAQGTRFLSLDFLKLAPSRKPSLTGFMPAIWGSVWVCATCIVIALPMGVGSAIFLEEYKPKARWLKRLHGFVQLNIRNLAGVPSIVYGIIGLTCFVRMFGLFGSPNEAMYDRMVRLELRSGEVVQALRVDDTDTTLTIDSPRQGRMVIDRADIVHESEVLAHTHVFVLSDGTTLRGKLQSVENGHVTMDTGEGAQARVIPCATVASYSTENMVRFGREGSVFFVRFPFGGSVLAGGLTLALVVLPTIIIASCEALRAVPNSLRQGAFAIGCTRWQTVRMMVLPSALPGIMTGTILAMSRAIGEAAPLLVVGGFLFITFAPVNLMSDFAAMPLQIYNWAQRPQVEFHQVAATGIIVLMTVLLCFNGAAIVVRQIFQKRLG